MQRCAVVLLSFGSCFDSCKHLTIKAVPHVCTTNAWRALICLPDIFSPDGEYIEGWIVYETGEQVLVVEHCWCELAPGQTRHIVDPSIVFLVERGQPVQYFPGVRRSWKETEALEGEWFPHVRFENYGADGMGHPSYRAAYEQARQYGGALAQVTAKELVIHAAQLPPENGEVDAIEIIMLTLLPSSAS
jgi:hypothetical protein